MIRGLLSSEMGHKSCRPTNKPSSSEVQLRLDDTIYPLRSKLLVVYQKKTTNLDNIEQKEHYLI